MYKCEKDFKKPGDVMLAVIVATVFIVCLAHDDPLFSQSSTASSHFLHWWPLSCLYHMILHTDQLDLAVFLNLNYAATLAAHWPSFKCIDKWKGWIRDAKRSKEERDKGEDRTWFLIISGFPVSPSSLS